MITIIYVVLAVLPSIRAGSGTTTAIRENRQHLVGGSSSSSTIDISDLQLPPHEILQPYPKYQKKNHPSGDTIDTVATVATADTAKGITITLSQPVPKPVKSITVDSTNTNTTPQPQSPPLPSLPVP
jgi:hypothetical protein